MHATIQIGMQRLQCLRHGLQTVSTIYWVMQVSLHFIKCFLNSDSIRCSVIVEQKDYITCCYRPCNFAVVVNTTGILFAMYGSHCGFVISVSKCAKSFLTTCSTKLSRFTPVNWTMYGVN